MCYYLLIITSNYNKWLLQYIIHKMFLYIWPVPCFLGAYCYTLSYDITNILHSLLHTKYYLQYFVYFWKRIFLPFVKYFFRTKSKAFINCKSPDFPTFPSPAIDWKNLEGFIFGLLYVACPSSRCGIRDVKVIQTSSRDKHTIKYSGTYQGRILNI